MRELKELFDEIATDPGPPVPSSALMLAAARRAERRYRNRVAAGGVVATALAVVATVAIVPWWARTGTPTEPGVDPGGPAVEASPVKPVADASDVLDAIAAVLPDRFAIKRSATGDDIRLNNGHGAADKVPAGTRAFGAAVIVYDGPRAGEIDVSVLDLTAAADPTRRTEVPPAYFCATQPADGCRQITVDGRPVMVAADYRYPDHPTVRCAFAERSVPGRYVSIGICQGLTTFFPQSKPAALTAPIFTDAQLAALVADEILVG